VSESWQLLPHLNICHIHLYTNYRLCDLALVFTDSKRSTVFLIWHLSHCRAGGKLAAYQVKTPSLPYQQNSSAVVRIERICPRLLFESNLCFPCLRFPVFHAKIYAVRKEVEVKIPLNAVSRTDFYKPLLLQYKDSVIRIQRNTYSISMTAALWGQLSFTSA